MPRGQKMVYDDELIELVATTDEWADRPFTTADELADVIGVTRQAVHENLQPLVDDGDIEKYKPGTDVIYWREC